jgi:hypothetical protein
MGNIISNDTEVLYTSGYSGEMYTRIKNKCKTSFEQKYKECKDDPECIMFIIKKQYPCNKIEDTIYINHAKDNKLSLKKYEWIYEDIDDYHFYLS